MSPAPLPVHSPDPAPSGPVDRWPAPGRSLLLAVAGGLAVAALLGLLTDLRSLTGAVLAFDWRSLPAILGLTLGNYLLRFLKWHYYLRVLGVRDLPWSTSLLVFLSGLAMVVTPGKVGEWLKSYLLRTLRGVPVSASAPIVLAERLTDGLALVVLATAGLVHADLWPLLTIGLAGLGLALVAQGTPLWLRLLDRLPAWPLVERLVGPLRLFLQSARALLAPHRLLLGVGLGVISWGGECLAFALVLAGLGARLDLGLVREAAFAFAVAGLLGALSFLPGGLGVAEGSLTGLVLVRGLLSEPARAVAAALLIRLGTLWFGVALGWLALALLLRRWPHRLRPSGERADALPESSGRR